MNAVSSLRESGDFIDYVEVHYANINSAPFNNLSFADVGLILRNLPSNSSHNG